MNRREFGVASGVVALFPGRGATKRLAYRRMAAQRVTYWSLFLCTQTPAR